MKGWKKILFWVGVFLIAPWLLIILASQLGSLFLSPSGDGVISGLESLRNWGGLKLIGIALSVFILFFGKGFAAWYIRTRISKPDGFSDEQFEAASVKAVSLLHWLLLLAVGLNLFYILFV
ncbi:MAG TPA: hypothetical protein DCL39_06730 [Alteromonas macleodii]|nr:hypothetical protein [Alteromonas macleodii]OZB99458.1 hypothetical protein BBP29_01700 [Alteromonas macleodii]HAA96631.1 hypothetical protein [Alteromonas macleodii]HAG29135.1 hypothetical protein [Alteromonas macleodii]HAM16898.1 hypothetical protein [Alteromonas macleodii]